MSSTPVEIGTLIAVILKAKNLPNKRHIGKQDPYCCASFHDEKRRTRAIKRGGQHPEWDEEVRFALFEDTDGEHDRTVDGGDTPPPPPPKNGKGLRKIKGGTSMKIQCFADDPREPDLIGETMVDLTEVLTKGETDEWFTLMNKDKYCGEVYLELTFWSNELPPEKKVAPKPSRNNKQYAGPGTFIPSGESTSSLQMGPGSWSSQHSSSGNTFDEDRQGSLPPSLRSSVSSARVDLYSAPYEQKSQFSAVDRMANDFGELNVSEHRRRDSFPPIQSHIPQPSMGFSSLPAHSPHGLEPSTYSDGGSQFSYDRPATPTQSYHRATISESPHLFSGQPPYQPRYESNAPPSNYAFQQPSARQNGPRFSLPQASSGFMPIATSAASGFMPLSSHQPELSGFAPPPAQTPTPMGYGAPQISVQTGFAPLPVQTPAPSGFMPPMQSSPSSAFHQTQPYPLQAQSPFQYPQYAPQPPPSVPPQHYVPSPPQSAPPQQYLPPQPPPSVPPQSHSAPPQPYPSYITTTPSPPQDFVPPPPPPQNNSLSSSQGAGLRPLPQQPINYAQQPAQHQSSLPQLPSASQAFSPTQPGSVTFPTANGYSSIPPPPPPPQPGHERTRAQSYHPSSNSVPPPPPPPPPQFHSSSPSGRSSLPQPPVSYQQQQQPVYQPIPPPPPPPPQHLSQPPPPPPPLQSNSAQSYYPPSQPNWIHQGQPSGDLPQPQGQSGLT